jgi:hypothetical protein
MISEVWLNVGNDTFASYSAKELTDSVKFSLRHRNRKFIETAAVKSISLLITDNAAPKVLNEFIAAAAAMANDFIDMEELDEPQTIETLFSLGITALIGYGVFLVWSHFGLLWAIVFPLTYFLLPLLLILPVLILWGAIYLFGRDAFGEMFSILQARLKDKDDQNA